MATLGSQVSIVMMVCNEEYWIDLVLRPILKWNLPLYIADCASQDNTPHIIKALRVGRDFHYERWEEITPTENGLIRAKLAERATTPWILQVDGDELWIDSKFRDVLNTDIDQYKVSTGFIHAHNVLWVDGQFILANGISQHRLHRQDAKWRGKYPFESTADFGKEAHYFVGGPHAYHVRYLERSSLDDQTYIRTEKQMYFDPNNECSWNKPVDLFGELGVPSHYNPYVEKALRIKEKE